MWIRRTVPFGTGPSRWSDEPCRGHGDRSATILRERYARGEITHPEFDGMRRDLDEHLTRNAYEGDLAGKAGP